MTPRSLELTKRLKEDAQMQDLVNTMAPDRAAFWSETLAWAVHHAGVSPAPRRGRKWVVVQLPLPKVATG